MENYKLQLVRYYDKYASSRNASLRDSWKCDIRSYFRDFLITRQLGKILEIGSGTGQDSAYFRDSGFQVTAIDLSEENVIRCKQRGLHALVMDFYRMTFQDQAFESIYAFNCLYHVPSSDLKAIFQELKRVLISGGYMLIGQRGGMAYEGEYSNAKKTEPRLSVTFEKEEYESILRQYFRLTESHVVPVRDYEFHWFIVEKT